MDPTFQRKVKWLLLFCFCPLMIWSQPPAKLGLFDTFFSYSKDQLHLQAIDVLSIPEIPLLQQKFAQWDPFLYEITSKPLPDGGSGRLMAYLYVAQREFA